ncbi:hypothetical protein JHD50_00835 [Sulfurimonas sp. MAG313]|nr:HAMP domain-containing sensor histidine kinase [Sulfurimonas sp. MAG313]MDF1879856.1 hypothetical protein [Sulfurimonas sp. MAG313]
MLSELKSFIMNKKTESVHTELITLFISSSLKSSLAYISALIFFILLYYSYIPLIVFLPVIFIHILNQSLRFYFVSKYKDKKLSLIEKRSFVKKHIFLMLLGGTTWGISGALSILYAPSPYEYIMAVLLIAMAAGSIPTLSSIYRAYLSFNIPMLFVFIGSLWYSGVEFNFYLSIILSIFTYVVIKASLDVHNGLKRSIELKELYHKAQEELKIMNDSLEDRVLNEVDKNRRKDQQMLEQSRFAQMGEMISMIAHQWRQPLASISATTGAMSLHLQLEEFNQKYIEDRIEKVNTYTQYLSTTITDFRNFFKPDKEKTMTSLNDIVLGSLKIIGTSIESDGISVETFLESKIEFLSYPNELKQVLLNILKNAQDVFTENSIKSPCICITTKNIENEVELCISDNAGGIDEKRIAYIFDPYFTTKEKKDGTGLGLYMSKLIVEDHCDGSIQVRNVDDGACFTLTLPLS